MNLDARKLKYHDFVKVLERSKSNGLDITFKCLSVMLQKTIIVIAEDYLWLSHQIAFEDFDLFFVMNQDGEVGAVKLWNGDVLHCVLPYSDKANSKDNSVKETGYFDYKILNRSDAKHSQLVEVQVDECNDSKIISMDRVIEESTHSNCISSDHMIDPNETQPAVENPDGNNGNVSSVSGIRCDNAAKNHELISTTQNAEISNGTPLANCNNSEMREHETIHNDHKDSSTEPSIVKTATPIPNDTCSTSAIETTLNITSQESSLKETSTEMNNTSTSVCSIAGKILASCISVFSDLGCMQLVSVRAINVSQKITCVYETIFNICTNW